MRRNYGATPVLAGQTGTRVLAADHSGLICVDQTGILPATLPVVALSPTFTPLK